MDGIVEVVFVGALAVAVVGVVVVGVVVEWGRRAAGRACSDLWSGPGTASGHSLISLLHWFPGETSISTLTSSRPGARARNASKYVCVHWRSVASSLRNGSMWVGGGSRYAHLLLDRWIRGEQRHEAKAKLVGGRVRDRGDGRSRVRDFLRRSDQGVEPAVTIRWCPSRVPGWVPREPIALCG